MSDKFYDDLWLEAKKEISKLVAQDIAAQENELTEEAALKKLMPIYLKYRKVTKTLLLCYEQTIQSQKREIIEKFVGCSIGRMLEYKREIVKLNCSEYECPDDLLIKSKWTPNDIEISSPTMSANNQLWQHKKHEIDEQAFKKAVLMIQSHERARVGRKIAIRTRKQKEYNEKLMSGEISLEKEKENEKKIHKAVVTIQKLWRGFYARKLLRERANRLEELLGMASSSRDDQVLKKDEDNIKRRLDLRSRALADFEMRKNEQKSRVFEIKSPELMEDITDEIREWFRLWYNQVGHFGIFPPASDGGSVLIATEQVPSPQEFLSPQEKSDDKIESGDWVMPKSKVLDTLVELNRQYSYDWELQDDFMGDIYHEVQLETREIVDDSMRLELKRLNKALIKDHKDDKVKFKIPKAKGKRKKQKKSKSPDVSKIQEMFDELVETNIIKKYENVRLDEWVSDISYGESKLKNSLGNVKQAVIDYCILPMRSKQVHKLAPLTKSICIAGLPRSGKKLLANIICTEAGATLIDLTPSNLANYREKVTEKKLIKMVIAVARFYPSAVIILIDGGDKPWWKKVPPVEKDTKPKRLARLLPKIIKSISPGDQILVLGIAHEPWKSKKPFYKFYKKFIIIPPTDYNSLFIFYQKIISKYHGLDKNLDISSLARVTVGYPLGAVKEVLENILNVKRRLNLKSRPLKCEEILSELINHDPTQVVKQFKKFESKVKK
ncbi:dynein regulatory complex protein 11-like [Microplitis mediator]|uniref:dynein regulatory complex protein 11-like n=1 Tax=Microplitis mediator TaxID=375433 RepID=UPI00255647A3|nr:dynein regulatory complex protein 11-like [Microplitis mediator]